MSLVDMMKEISLGAGSSLVPVNLFPGTITSVNPLEIYVHPKLTLKKDFIVISESLMRHRRTVTFKSAVNIRLGSTAIDGVTESGGGPAHTHGYDTMTLNAVHNDFAIDSAVIEFEDELKVDDQVMLIRMQGGQRFYVVDRVVNA